MSRPLTIWTIGHSTLPVEKFIAALKANGIEQLIDIRTLPRSRHNPQFNKENLPSSLSAEGIAWRHMAGLGGLRHARPDSINTGWRNDSFRGYAGYMQSAGFIASLQELIAFGQKKPTAIMCAEAVPWRCHRSLVADALTVRDIPVFHIEQASHARLHRLTPFAKVNGTEITYETQLQLTGTDPGTHRSDRETRGGVS